MDAESAAGTVADWATAGAAVVAMLALVVSGLAWREARRSAVASEKSAEAAARSAAAEEAAIELAQTEAAEREAARHDAEGPQFERISGVYLGLWGRFTLRVVGGPGRMDVVASPPDDAPWVNRSAGGFFIDNNFCATAEVPSLESGDSFTLQAMFVDERDVEVEQLVLPVRLTATSRESPPRTWDRRVGVLLESPPPRPEGPPPDWDDG